MEDRNCELLFEYLRSILYDSEVKPLEIDSLDEPFQKLGMGLQYLETAVKEMKQCSAALSKGDLSSFKPARENFLCENLKKAKPEIRIVCGGPEVSYDTESFMSENPAVDAVIFGEGEYAFSMLCRALTKGTPKFPDIKGLAYRAGGRIIVNAPMPPVKFSSLPFPYEAPTWM